MKKAQVIIIRHGESLMNRERVLAGRKDSPLTQEGIKQIRKTAKFIKRRFDKIDLIFSSPLRRAFDTASIIGKKFGLVPVIDERLIETDFGNWEGLSKDKLIELEGWKSYSNDPFHFTFPGGESPQAVKERILDFKREILKDDSWERLIVVSHYTPIVFYILDVLSASNSPKASFKLNHGGVSIVEYRGNAEYLSMLNYLPD